MEHDRLLHFRRKNETASEQSKQKKTKRIQIIHEKIKREKKNNTITNCIFEYMTFAPST